MYEQYSEWKLWKPESFGKRERADSIYFKSELAIAGICRLQEAIVLEIGFGNGKFAGWAIDNGAIYVGLERIGELVERGREMGLEVYEADAALSCMANRKDSLDIVVAFDVFEHLSQSELRSLLSKLHDLLKVGGRLIARFPSGDSPFARAIQHGDVTHQLAIGSSAVHQLAAIAGFEVMQVREPAFPIFGSGMLTAVRRCVVTLVRAIVYPLVARIFMGGGRFVLTPNMVVVLVRRNKGS